MASVSLDQVLRTLEPRGEVCFTLGDVPIDELLLTLHEVRFTGVVDLGNPNQSDRVVFKGGRILDCIPEHYQHVKLLTDVLIETRAVSMDSLRRILEADPNLDGDHLGRAFVGRGMLTPDRWREVVHEQARRRLFYLYDHSGGPATVRQGFPKNGPLDALPVDLLPAVAYGIVVRAHPRRRQAMLAFAANKRARLLSAYDIERNRCGLPQTLLSAAELLSTRVVHFGPQPCLPGLTPDTTAGVLLLFQRISLLEIGEITTRPEPEPSTKRPTEVLPRRVVNGRI